MPPPYGCVRVRSLGRASTRCFARRSVKHFRHRATPEWPPASQWRKRRGGGKAEWPRDVTHPPWKVSLRMTDHLALLPLKPALRLSMSVCICVSLCKSVCVSTGSCVSVSTCPCRSACMSVCLSWDEKVYVCMYVSVCKRACVYKYCMHLCASVYGGVCVF